MIYKKTADGERISAVTSEGIALGYIQKMYFCGDRSKCCGWEHFVFSPKFETYVLACHDPKPDQPWIFSTIKKFKQYYDRKEENSHE